MADNKWEVFQRDVLDVIRGYRAYMDFMESVASSGTSRPDCLIRISRDEKKEIWVIDAKGKQEIAPEDRERMEKYIEMISSNPIDTGLEPSEVPDYDFRGIFVTEKGSIQEDGFEQVSFGELHQFLQRELVYTNTEKAVRDVARMMESSQLTQAQARLLFRSLKPYEQRVSKAMEKLEELETKFVGLELQKPPIEDFDFDLPVEALMKHEERDVAFLVDVPYSREALQDIGSKVEQVEQKLEHIGGKVYYSAVNTFEPVESEYVVGTGEIEERIKETAAILSPENILELFSPKIPLEKEFGQQFVEVRDNIGMGYRARVSTTNGISHTIEVLMPEEAAESLRESMVNTREIGEIEGKAFRQEIEIKEDLRVEYEGNIEPLHSYRDAVRGVFQSPVNRVLGKKVNSEIK